MFSYILAGTTTQSSYQSFNDHTHHRRSFSLPTWPVICKEIDLTPSIQKLKEWAQVTSV